MAQPSEQDVLALAAIIRTVNGGDSLEAPALAQAILSDPRCRWQPLEQEKVNIDKLDIDLATRNALRRAGMKTVQDILKRGEAEISFVNHIGKTRLTCLKASLAQLGYNLQ